MTDFRSNFNRWKEGLNKTRKVAFGRIATVFGATEINEDTWDELESILVQADMGIETTEEIIREMKRRVDDEGIIESSELQETLRKVLIDRLETPPEFNPSNYHPAVILLVGVNGSGKTTTAAKLGKQFSQRGKKILLVAADTYRAAAVDQLQVWGDRLKLTVIAGQPGGDPGAVTYDAIQSALAIKRILFLWIQPAGFILALI
jgi:fused signal recognition particle receptor